MHRFVAETSLPHPVREVFDWHARPGAIRRLLPPWEPVTVAQEAADLSDGAEAILRLAGPPASVSPRWVARHTGLEPPREFTDVQVSGPFDSWRHRHLFESAEVGSRMRDEVSYRLPLGSAGDLVDGPVRTRLRRMFAYRHRQLADDLAAHAAADTGPLTVAVTGASGLIGQALTAFLTTGGHRVIRLVRRSPRVPDEVYWDPERAELDPAALREADAVVNLAGAPLAGRFNRAHKDAVRRSRILGTGLLSRALVTLRRDGTGPRVFVSGSAIGYYGAARGAEPLDERSGPGDDFLATLCREWEAAASPAREAGVRVVQVRTGVVQSPAGGMLHYQLPQFLAAVGGRLGPGDQWLSWVSIDDIVGIFHHALTHDEVSGPVNGVAPAPVTNAGYTSTLAGVLHRPALLPVPSFAPRLLLGTQGAELTLLASQRARSDVLARTGYRFRQPDLDSCLRHVLGRT